MLNETLEKPRHEMFAQLIYSGETPTNAYKEAGYRPSHSNAWRMSRQEHIVTRVTQLHDQTRVRVGVTAGKLSQELDAVRLAAFRAGQYGVAATAIMGKAKLHGLLIDKVKHDVSSLTALLEEIDGTTRGLTLITPPTLELEADKP